VLRFSQRRAALWFSQAKKLFLFRLELLFRQDTLIAQPREILQFLHVVGLGGRRLLDRIIRPGRLCLFIQVALLLAMGNASAYGRRRAGDDGCSRRSSS